jgi:uncharacterized protein DUF1064
MSKYHATAQVVDNIRFDSKKEAARYCELKLLIKAKLIRNLVLQPSYPLEVLEKESRPIGIYRADFAYEQLEIDEGGMSGRWRPVVEDVKGFKTPLYRWKKKHVELQYGIEIRET